MYDDIYSDSEKTIQSPTNCQLDEFEDTIPQPKIQTIEERYKKIEKIGQGGMGTVYKVLDMQLNRIVALKILNLDNKISSEQIQRFIREAKILANFHHPNIVTIYDICQEEQKIYYSMDYIQGSTLQELIEKKGPLAEKKALQIIIRVAKALQVIHSNGIVHRDIKPSNIVYTPTHEIKLLDFGTAKLESDNNLTRMNEFLGTVLFASPEQFNNSNSVDLRSDIYSLGVTFYFLLAGEPPFRGTSAEIIGKHLFGPVPSLEDKVSKHVNSMMMKMLAKKPEERYQNIAQFFEDVLHPEQSKKDADSTQYTLWTHHIVRKDPFFAKYLKKIIYIDEDSGQSMLDMTTPTWNAFPYKQKKHAIQQYQLIYAQSYGMSPEQTFVCKDVSFTMQFIPPGRFLMGAGGKEKYKHASEMPQHIVVISTPFWMSQTPITKKQWKMITKETPWRGQENQLSSSECPAIYISWDDINRKFLSQLQNEYALPTEAEWEYACKAGMMTAHFWDNGEDDYSLETLDKYIWFANNTVKKQRAYAPVVKQKLPNPWGLYDMIGNVWEKCSDIYDKYSIEEQCNPQGGTQGIYRVDRGSSWDSNATECRAAKRSFSTQQANDAYTGFRLVKKLQCIKNIFNSTINVTKIE